MSGVGVSRGNLERFSVCRGPLPLALSSYRRGETREARSRPSLGTLRHMTQGRGARAWDAKGCPGLPGDLL